MVSPPNFGDGSLLSIFALRCLISLRRYHNWAGNLPSWLRRNQLPVGARSILDAERVGAAAAAIRGSVRRTGPPGYPKYPGIHHLEAVPDVPLLDTTTMEDIIRGLPDAAVDMLRQASIQLSDVIGYPSILLADPCALATESTETIIELKTITALVCLIWRELNAQNCQLSQHVKKEWFALAAGPFLENLLAVARSFSDASWSAYPAQPVLTIFDALVDVLYSIQGLPLNSSVEVAGIASKIVSVIGGIIAGITNDIDSSEESAIHPANYVLVQVLAFFHDNRDKMQSLLSTGDPCSDMFNCWTSKLEGDAENIFPDDMGRRYIFLFSNACYMRQMMCLPGGSFSSIELVSRLVAMIQQYKKSYIDEFWVPLKSYLEGDSLMKPRRLSLYKFTAGYLTIRDGQMTWKVPAELRYALRGELVDLIVPPYEEFLRALQANPSRLSEALYSLKRVMWRKKKQEECTVEQLKEEIGELYESSDTS